jgi:hypothetical protein
MKRLSTYLTLLGATAASVAFAVSTATASPAKGQTVYKTMIIVGHELGQKGSDGLRHDTTYGANFSVAKGQRVTVTIWNYDEGPHTFTAPGLKLNVTIPGAKDEEKGIPSKTVFSFTASKVGTFRWFCSLPCDKGQGYWAMKTGKNGMGQDGYMAGYVTVSA